MTRRNSAWWRRRIWAGGTILMVAAYFFGAARLPQRTAVGTEQYLFGVGPSVPPLIESPQGGVWLIVPDTNPSSPGTGNSAVETVLSAADNFYLASGSTSPRLMAPFARPAATYRLRGRILSRVWRRRAASWIAPNYLADGARGYQGGSAVLDLRSGLTFSGQAGRAIVEKLQAASDEETEDESFLPDEDPPTDLSALEGLSPDTTIGSRKVRIGERSFWLGTLRSKAEPPRTIISTDEEVPRTLELVRNAYPWALSRDGRTLFFVRAEALWRLDLAQPLPALLEANSLPPLPEPPED